MSLKKTEIYFSKLLKVFTLNKKPAYIIEIVENNKKTLCLSYEARRKRLFLLDNIPSSYQRHFNKLPEECLISKCEIADYMLYNSPITHFEADCDSLTSANYMFAYSNIKYIKINTPKLRQAEKMFFLSKVVTAHFNAPKLENADFLFQDSKLKNFSGRLDSLSVSFNVFAFTNLESFNCTLPKMKDADFLFNEVNKKFKLNYPFLFV